MIASQAFVPTARARRYLAQLCKHGSAMGLRGMASARGHSRHAGAAPPGPRTVEASETEGLIDFGWARCIVRATEDGLLLRAEADDEQLRRMQDGVGNRIAKIGRRDQLSVTWHPAGSGAKTSDQ